MKYINEDKTVITLPVPLGSVLYQVATKCGDFCLFQQEHFDKIFPPTKERRCEKEAPCHTVRWNVYKVTLSLSNLGWVLEDFGTWIFPTEKEAEKRMADLIAENRKRMKNMGFELRSDGYGKLEEG